MPTYERTDRISEEIRKNISFLIRDELKDPGLAGMSSITRVEVTRDLRYAKVFVSVFGSSEDGQSTVKSLNHSAGYVRHRIGEMMDIHYIPQFQFILDDSISYSIEINKKIEALHIPTEEKE